MKELAKFFGSNCVFAAFVLCSAFSTYSQTKTVNVGPGEGWTLFGGATWAGSNTILAQLPGYSAYSSSGGYEILTGVNVGTTYTFDTLYETDTGISLTGFDPVCLLLTFENSSWVNIGTVEYGYGNDSGGFNYSAPVEDLWYEGSVSGTAPVGATSVIVFALFVDANNFTTEDVYFNDMSVTPLPTPEPTTYALGLMGLVGLFALRVKPPRVFESRLFGAPAHP